MKIDWRLFGGIRPRLRPHLLGQEEAQRAVNCKLWSGAAEPFKQPAYVKDLPAGTKTTIYRHGQNRTDEEYWCSWTTVTAPAGVDVARGFVADDTDERFFFTGEGPIAQYSDNTLVVGSEPLPAASVALGIEAPGAVSLSYSPTSGESTVIFFAAQFVSAGGERGPIGPASPDPAASAGLTYYHGDSITINGIPTSLDPEVTHVDLYVATTDSNGVAQFRFWKRVSEGTTTLTDDIDFDLLGEAPDSPSLVAPPDGLFGLMAHPGGFLCGFADKSFCRSEVFKPHGWPTVYRDPLPDYPVGGAVLGASVVICTKGKTYLYTGNDPLNQIKNDLEGWQPCVSKRSIQKTTAGVIYASADGLVLVNGMGPLQLVTANHFTRTQWQAYKPESSHAAVHDDRYFWWWDAGGGVRGLLIFEFGGSGVQMVVESNVYATAAFADHRKDELYFALASDGHLYKWDAGASATTQVWRSKLFHLDRPQNVGAVKIEADTYPVTFRLYGDGSLADTVTVNSEYPTTLRGDLRYREVFMEIECASRVDSVTIASSIFDMRHGQ